jgi:hypothetical protein
MAGADNDDGAPSFARWRGFSEGLQTPNDLVAKMQTDYERMMAAPTDPYPAFDFFVAAEHIVDWRWPDDSAMRREIRSRDPAKTVSHLANGAKHFEATDPRHTSVRDVATDRNFGAAFDPAIFDPRAFDVGRPALVITMSDGRQVDAAELAALVLEYWRTELGPTGPRAIPDDTSTRSAAE